MPNAFFPPLRTAFFACSKWARAREHSAARLCGEKFRGLPEHAAKYPWAGFHSVSPNRKPILAKACVPACRSRSMAYTSRRALRLKFSIRAAGRLTIAYFPPPEIFQGGMRQGKRGASRFPVPKRTFAEANGSLLAKSIGCRSGAKACKTRKQTCR